MRKAMYSALSKEEIACPGDAWESDDSVIKLKTDSISNVEQNDSGVIDLKTGGLDHDNDHVGLGARTETIASGLKPAESKSKRIFDVVVASMALVWFLPLLVVIFFLVRRDGGPAFFVQQRVGRDSQLFPCYKFRSMVLDAETALKDLLVCNEQFRTAWDTKRKLENDPRITGIGAFLRTKSLDELPQLWNIIRGDMSIVGPRPIVPDELEMYGSDLQFYVEAKPGLTGAWQVSGRNETTYAERVALDVEYTSNWTFWRDVKIIVKTFGVVFSGRGAL